VSISSEELIALLRGTVPKAAPVEQSHVEMRINMIEQKGVTARLDSPSSQFLQRTVKNFHQYWGNEIAEQMQATELYGADIPVVNAFAQVTGKRRQIILLQGIQHVVLFYAHFITVLNLLMQFRGDRHIEIDGWKETEPAAFSLAGYSLLYDYMRTGEQLIAVGDMLGPRAAQNTTLGYQATIGFLLAHELGHHVLGHTLISGTRAERNHVSLAIEESIDLFQQQEFEADQFALNVFPPHLRAVLMSSVIFFFGPMAFMEAFNRPAKATHPLFTNRAAYLISLLPPEDENTPIVAGILRSQIEGFKRTGETFGMGETDIRPRIHDTMPVEFAYKVVHAIKKAVAEEHGVLDTPDSE
jgi:hypothetical protein